MLTSFIWHLTHFPTPSPAVTAAQNFSIGSVEFSFCWVAKWVRFKIMPSLSLWSRRAVLAKTRPIKRPQLLSGHPL